MMRRPTIGPAPTRRVDWDELAAIVAAVVNQDDSGALDGFDEWLEHLERQLDLEPLCGSAPLVVVARRFGRVHAAAVRAGLDADATRIDLAHSAGAPQVMAGPIDRVAVSW